MINFRNILRYFYMSLWNHLLCFFPSYNIRYLLLKYMFRANIGKCTIHSGVKFFSPWKLIIGDNVNVQWGSFIDCRGGVVIGDNVDITMGVKILSEYHNIDSKDYKTVSQGVKISNYAVIGSFSLILPGVHIGEGTVIGAGSVVSKTTESYSLYCGSPAVFKRKRSTVLSYNPYYKRPFH